MARVALLAVVCALAAPTAQGGEMYCTANAECSWSGDDNATCASAAGTCNCGSAFSGPICQIPEEDNGGMVPETRTNLVVTLEQVACDRPNLNALATLTDTKLADAGFPDATALGVCGSISIVVEATLNTTTFASAASVVADVMRDALVEMRLFTGVVNASEITVEVRASPIQSGALSVCAANATNTVVVHGNCVVLECSTGHSLTRTVSAGVDLFECTAIPETAAPAGSDDDLTGGVIVAIVLGSVAFVALVGVGVFYFTTKGSAGESFSENEPSDLREEDDARV